MKQTRALKFLFLVLLLLTPSPVAAQTTTSPSYRVDEYQFGSGGELDATSPNFRAHSSVGSLGVGETSSANYDGIAGLVTPSEPFLEMIVTGASVNFGTLSDTSTAYGAAQAGVCSCSFTVRTYLSSDYSVLTMSQPPTNESGVSLAAKSTTGPPSSNQDTEEFGINLVANTIPAVMGALPSNQPDNTFADGKAFGDGGSGARDYDDTNEYAYGVGDTIAQSPATPGNQAVGQTNYTISYIAKRKPLTAAGVYNMNHMLVVVPTF